MMPRSAAAAGAGTAPVSDVSDPCVTVAIPHDDSVGFVAGRLQRGSGSGGGGGGSHFVCVVEDRAAAVAAPGGPGGPRFVAVDNLEVLYAARASGAERVGIRVVDGCCCGGGDRAGKGGRAGRAGGREAALREHLTRSSLHSTIDPFAAAEAVGLLRSASASGGDGKDGGGDGKGASGGDAGGASGGVGAHLGPYLERAVSLGFAARPRGALSDMVRRVYACGVRQAPPLPFLISVSRLDEESQVVVADATARLCEAVRQRHFTWPGADVIRLLLQGAGLDAGQGGAPQRTPAAAPGAARLPPTLRPAAADAGGGAGGGLDGRGGSAAGTSRGGRPDAGPPAASSASPAATESRAARLSIFYCAGCEKRYCVVRGGVREVTEDRDGCYVVSPGPAPGGGDAGAAGQPAEVIHALPSAQREYLGLDDDSSLRVVRAGGAEALRKKADDLCRRGTGGPFVVLYAADRGRRPPGRGRKRRIRA